MTHRNWIVLAGIGIGAAAVVAAYAAQETVQSHLNVKLGLWEVATQPQVTGDMSAAYGPEMQNMTPEQRARMQAAMQRAMAAMQKPRVVKQCMTAEKLARGFDTSDDASCKSTVVTNSSTNFETHEQCSGPDGNRSVNMHLSATSSDHVVGTMHSDMTRNGKAVTFDAKLEGKWLSADCGNIKDAEVEKTP